MKVIYCSGNSPEDMIKKSVSNIASIDFDDDHILLYRKNKSGMCELLGFIYLDNVISIEEI